MEITDGCWVRCIGGNDIDQESCNVHQGEVYQVERAYLSTLTLKPPNNRYSLWKREFCVLDEFEQAVLNA